MNWTSIRENWNALRGRLAAHEGAPAARASSKVGCRRSAYLHEHCRVSTDEANRRKRDWIKDPGVLDDWNDTRSILDM
jgi:hypothetical protein